MASPFQVAARLHALPHGESGFGSRGEVLAGGHHRDGILPFPFCFRGERGLTTRFSLPAFAGFDLPFDLRGRVIKFCIVIGVLIRWRFLGVSLILGLLPIFASGVFWGPPSCFSTLCLAGGPCVVY